MDSRKGIVYFDGLCLACSMEINHYRRLPGSENFLFLDITAADFDPITHGLDPKAVHKIMHVKDKSGQLHTGVDAFRTIWQQIPRYRFLWRWTERGPARTCVNFGYNLFVLIRPYLPRRNSAYF